MFRVLVVDDEPSAVEYICNIIKMKCPDLNVVGTAENGLEGLAEYQVLEPDLVVSDVKMPVMDGLLMVKSIREMNPEAQILLVSGYQEFKYVKEALSIGVSDYVLKPMTPANFVKSAAPIIKKLKGRMYEQRKVLIRQVVAGEKADEDEIRTYFPEEEYYLAVIRENGLPRRFTGNYGMEMLSELEDTIFVYGRDEREALYICPANALNDRAFSLMIEKEAFRKKNDSNFVTTVMMEKAVERNWLPKAMEQIYRSLNSRLSIGVNQRFFAEEGEKDMDKRKELYDKEALRSMERFLEKKEYDMLLERLWEFIKSTERAAYPQLCLERFVRQLALKIQQYRNFQGDVFEDEMMMEDAFYYAGSVEELFDSLKSIFIRYWKEDREAVKLDSNQFLDTMKCYIDQHMAEDITVSTVCKEFGLSQSYLNMIFRKYGMQSFNIYLRTVRIEKAKRIMERNPQMFIKDIAMMAGYKDQFYFSRIFRAVTGMSPSEYIERGSVG